MTPESTPFESLDINQKGAQELFSKIRIGGPITFTYPSSPFTEKPPILVAKAPRRRTERGERRLVFYPERHLPNGESNPDRWIKVVGTPKEKPEQVLVPCDAWLAESFGIGYACHASGSTLVTKKLPRVELINRGGNWSLGRLVDIDPGSACTIVNNALAHQVL